MTVVGPSLQLVIPQCIMTCSALELGPTIMNRSPRLRKRKAKRKPTPNLTILTRGRLPTKVKALCLDEGESRDGGIGAASDVSANGLLSRSRPVSVASSIGGDSPATPPIYEREDEHRWPKHGEG
ncbi:hypothetical protein F5Y03DRAFT_333085, partial [Xylaria venustula]